MRTNHAYLSVLAAFFVIAACLSLASPVSAAPYVFPGPGVIPSPGPVLPPPGTVTGKEFSHFLDRDAAGLADPEQNVAWDGVGGTMDGNDYSGTRLTFPVDDQEVDALAAPTDALFDSLRADTSHLLFSVGNGLSPVGSGAFLTAEGQAIGYAGDVSYEVPGAITKGVWAVGATDIDKTTPPRDVDGLELWGPEPPGFDSTHYSLLSDAAVGGVSVWNLSGSPYVPHGMIVSAVTSLLGPIPTASEIDPDHIDLDALLVRDGDGVTEQFGGPGDSLIFSIRQLRDLTDPDGFYATGSEIFTLDATAAGLTPGFLAHGGHLWDHPYSLAAMTDAVSGRQLDINALETASAEMVPEPGTIVMLLSALAGLGLCFRRRSVK